MSATIIDGLFAAPISSETAREVAARLIEKADAAEAMAAEEAAKAERAKITKPGTFLIGDDGATFYVEEEGRIWILKDNATWGTLDHWQKGRTLKPVQRSYAGGPLGLVNERITISWRDPAPRGYGDTWERAAALARRHSDPYRYL